MCSAERGANTAQNVSRNATLGTLCPKRGHSGQRAHPWADVVARAVARAGVGRGPVLGELQEDGVLRGAGGAPSERAPPGLLLPQRLLVELAVVLLVASDLR